MLKFKIPEKELELYHKLNPQQKEEFIRFASFGVNTASTKILSSLTDSSVDYESPHLELIHFMSRPENFWFTCKWLFNVNLSPFQVSVLQELWQRKFPMLIASRGSGKTFILAIYSILRALFQQGAKVVIVGAAFRQAKFMFDYMNKVWDDSPIFRDICGLNNHPKRDIDQCFFNIGTSTVTAIPLGDGCLSKNMLITYDSNIGYTNSYHLDNTKQINYINRSIYCDNSFNTSNESYYNGKKELFNITTSKGYYLECTNNHRIKVLRNNKIIFSELQNITKDDLLLIDRGIRWHSGKNELTIDDGYLCGLMIGDGSWVDKYKLQLTSIDREIIDFASKHLNIKESGKDGVHYFWYGKDLVQSFINTFDLKDRCYTIDKEIPQKILNSDKGVVRACLQGLFDTDGSLQVSTRKGGTSICISFSNTSKKLIEQIQFLLLHFGIISKLTNRKRDEKWNIAYELSITGRNSRLFAKNIGFRLSRKKNKLLNAIKKQVRDISNDDRILGIKDILYSLCKRHGIVNKFKLKGRKELSRETCKSIFDALKNIEDVSWLGEILKDNIYYDSIKSINSIGIHDCYDMCVENTHEYTANGIITHNSKIRGLRAHYIIADEFACLDRNTIIETNNGMMRISDSSSENVLLLNENGDFEKPHNFIITPKTDVYKITTKYGYSFKCSSLHKVKTSKGYKLAKDLTNKDWLVYENKYKFPVRKSHNNLAFNLGLLSDRYKDDFVPKYILQGTKQELVSYFDGLFLKYTNKKLFTYCSKSEQFIDDIHILLRKLNIFGYKSYNAKQLKYLITLDSKYTTFLYKILEEKDFCCNDDIKYVQVKNVKLLSVQDHLYDFYLPKTNSFYGNGFIQHNSIPLEIFEVVIKGFGAVSANPTDRAEKVSKIDLLRQLGEMKEAQEIEDSLGFGNQTIVSGTAYYAFNHFYNYWKRYKTIIESKGDTKILSNIFPDGKIQDGFNWRDFSIIRLPYELLPKGFMDESQIASAKATIHKSLYQMEYGAVFAEDSDGFFKRSLIETCVTKKPIQLSNGNRVRFFASLNGSSSLDYVYGIDPASERDNLALVILEVHPDHRRIVYCWTLNKSKLRERLSSNDSDKKMGFYNYCARKVRNLLKVFPSKHIGIDTQGGGFQLVEALHNPSDMLIDEKPLWPYIVEGNNPMKPDPFWWEPERKPTDIESGDHILHEINFAKAEFTSSANHGLKKDFEDKRVLFPAYDTAILADALAQDKVLGREYDNLEDCFMEIEELKDELSTIELTQTTAQAREHWDTPEEKKPGGRKGRMRKDRYTALIIANMLARAIENRLQGQEHNFIGGFAGQDNKKNVNKNKLYTGPEHLVSQIPSNYKGISFRRR